MYQKTAAPTAINRMNGAGWKATADHAKSKLAYQKNAQVLAIRNLRESIKAVASAAEDAHAEWERINEPVALGLPKEVHPDVRDLLHRCLEENGLADKDLTAPLSTTGLDELVARRVAEAKAANEDAARRLAQIEREQASAALAKAQAGFDAVVATYGDGSDQAVSETAADEEPAKRGRGRPPRVSLDPASDVQPET